MIKEFIEKVGSGTTGEVWRGKDELGREVAIKFFNTPIDKIRERVVQHAAALGQIKHENVIGIYAVDDLKRPNAKDIEAEPALVMEYAAGISFADWLGKPTISAQEAGSVIDGLIAGLNAFHTRRLAHGDIHAKNVHVVGTVPKLIDPIAHDPTSIITTAEFAQRRRMDLHHLKYLINQTLLAANASTEEYGNFCFLNTGETTLVQIGEYAHRALNLSTTITRQPHNVYYSFRTAQSKADFVGWQELRKSAIRLLQGQLDQWRENNSSVPADPKLREQCVYGIFPQINELVSILLAAAEYGKEPYTKDLALMRSLLDSTWPSSGNSRYVEIPQTLIYLLQYAIGGAALSNGHTEVAMSVANLKIPRGPYQSRARLLECSGVVGWPETLGHHCREAWETLVNGYSHVAVYRSVFPTELMYKSAVTAHNLLLFAMDFSERQRATRVASGERPMHMNVPPMFLGEGTKILDTAWQFLGDGQVIRQLVVPNAQTKDEDIKAWMGQLSHGKSAFHEWLWGSSIPQFVLDLS
ncbi:MAG TPA: protein kinase [Phycisphaerae bacterium]|nr:protein kinase [Phycisphaerae bacterium]